MYIVKPDKVADFESSWAAIRAKLSASEKPELKALGESIKVYKIAAGADANGQTYFFVADPASKTVSYGLSPFLLFASGLFTRAEGDALFAKIQPTLVNIVALPVNKVQ